jgi:hypothetical protein
MGKYNWKYGGLGGGLGWFDEKEEAPPSLTDIFQEYPDILQILMDTSNRFAPQQAELQAKLQEQYMPRLMQSQQDALSQVSPEAAGLTELLATQAKEGMSGDLTDSERRAFMDMQKSVVGEQATSGIGTDYMGANLLEYINGRKQGAQQLGLQTSSLLPRLSFQTPQYTDYSQQYSPGQFIGNEQSQQQLNYSMAPQDLMSQLLPVAGQVAGFAIGGPAGAAIGGGIGSSLSSSQSSRSSLPQMSNLNQQSQNPYYYPINSASVYGRGGSTYGF